MDPASTAAALQPVELLFHAKVPASSPGSHGDGSTTGINSFPYVHMEAERLAGPFRPSSVPRNSHMRTIGLTVVYLLVLLGLLSLCRKAGTKWVHPGVMGRQLAAGDDETGEAGQRSVSPTLSELEYLCSGVGNWNPTDDPSGTSRASPEIVAAVLSEIEQGDDGSGASGSGRKSPEIVSRFFASLEGDDNTKDFTDSESEPESVEQKGEGESNVRTSTKRPAPDAVVELPGPRWKVTRRQHQPSGDGPATAHSPGSPQPSTSAAMHEEHRILLHPYVWLPHTEPGATARAFRPEFLQSKRLITAIAQYQQGYSPTPQEVIWIKRELFFSPLNLESFALPHGDPWRNDDDNAS